MCAVGNLFPLANSRTRWCCNFKRLSQHERLADFSKISAPHSLTTYRMNLILAGSISLHSTFNINNRTFLKPASGFYSGVTSMLSVTKIGFGGKAKPQVIYLKTLCAVCSELRIFGEMEKYYSFWLCQVILIIKICVMVLFENCR